MTTENLPDRSDAPRVARPRYGRLRLATAGAAAVVAVATGTGTYVVVHRGTDSSIGLTQAQGVRVSAGS